MPKKFKGTNTKAETARSRKAAAREASEVKRREEAEDALWQEDDKLVLRKLSRKADKERKQREVKERKLANKTALDEEEKNFSPSGKNPSPKMTRAKIQEIQDKEIRDRNKAQERAKEVSNELEENINHVIAKEVAEGNIVEARSVEDAITALSISEGKIDRHPERRLKAAYTAYEEQELPRLREEHSNLRLSQVKQLVKKNWQKSPDNPMNQIHTALNNKS
ncbi:Coiled-coil domain-containing protein 124 [Trichoplax sp. H2]|uniref:Coiled-coil domain-containing protein n=1 Tax=Trichoplax adhaerens TaxID=10228 RepID=B3RRU8_TRIAD|nr:hypothetical protein TRIADDRAFT_49999 [Trichoplax adhaerens]EDV26934.1 hypothetical protein TRIADDRAFT_49999 [Trichoplax adhaerens]RDD43787.1 Coiled-coil domain-containing protein 124 [Trichoplax sp. H2]|eukprot:XP_002110930.1 hypothetical protein TRIADDRAFT_49999 [Trichoplax adhaerens]